MIRKKYFWKVKDWRDKYSNQPVTLMHWSHFSKLDIISFLKSRMKEKLFLTFFTLSFCFAWWLSWQHWTGGRNGGGSWLKTWNELVPQSHFLCPHFCFHWKCWGQIGILLLVSRILRPDEIRQTQWILLWCWVSEANRNDLEIIIITTITKISRLRANGDLLKTGKAKNISKSSLVSPAMF